MAIVSGTVGGQAVTFSSASQSVSQLAQSIISANNTAAVTGSTVLNTSFFTALNTQPATIIGSTPTTVGVLAGGNAQFRTGTSQASEIVASDNSASSIINNNVNGGLIAFTGIGGNALVGNGVINAFQTATGGQDAVSFSANGQAAQTNLLTSLGQDTVTVFGAGTVNGTTNQLNFVSAYNTGTDNIALRTGAGLTFVNQSSGTSTITASSGSTINTGGAGSTVILDGSNSTATYGSGAVTFNVSTANGNVTLVGSAAGVDTYNFDKLGQGASTAIDVVGQFNNSSFIHLVGYEPGSYTAAVVGGSTVLTLSDNAQIVFAGVGSVNQVLSRIT